MFRNWKLGAGKMAQLVKCVPWRLGPSTHVKQPTPQCEFVTSQLTRGGDKKILGAYLAARWLSSMFSKRPYQKKKKKR